MLRNWVARGAAITAGTLTAGLLVAAPSAAETGLSFTVTSESSAGITAAIITVTTKGGPMVAPLRVQVRDCADCVIRSTVVRKSGKVKIVFPEGGSYRVLANLSGSWPFSDWRAA